MTSLKEGAIKEDGSDKKGGRPSPEVVTEDEVDETPMDTAKTAREEPCSLQDDDPPRQDTANTKSKKTREEACQLTSKQEADITAWFEDNPCLYNESLREYRYADKKTRNYAEKA